eukprot:m.25984 g.25984  ORF g.25984 m.25984 type:complete len:462 (+) comp13231_c0_seq3:83-1468(+)
MQQDSKIYERVHFKMELRIAFRAVFALGLCTSQVAGEAVARAVRVSGRDFVLTSTNARITMSGPNVVVKGPPYIPSVSGTTYCNDVVNDECTKTGTCKTCYTFNEADVQHMKTMGWDTIRLGVAWAGAQPRDDDALDPDFVERLHALLNLTDRTGIHVILDNHGDMVGGAGCGNGVPMWFQQKAAPELIGKQLTTGFPYNLVPSLEVTKVGGYNECGDNATMWAQHAGDANYNLINDCCKALNAGGNPPGLGYTTIAQKTMDYMINPGPGRDAFVRYWTLMATAVASHPSAFAAELMNEPMTINRKQAYNTWRATAEAINSVIPDMAVSMCDTGEGAIIPAWVSAIGGDGLDLDKDTEDWIINSNTAFYAWHWYGFPTDAANAVKSVMEISEKWNLPTFATEFGSCDAWVAARDANISHTYWHYSSYCDTGAAFGNKPAPADTFGACILGWAGGNSNYTCK